MSILLSATTIGTPAARACAMASSVCGRTPSSAATTMMAMSVTRVPRARMAEKASWPGVSRKVMRRVVEGDEDEVDAEGEEEEGEDDDDASSSRSLSPPPPRLSISRSQV